MLTKNILFRILLILLIANSIISCNNLQNNKTDYPIAKVGDNYLYTSDIKKIVFQNATKSDSIQIVNKYIENWIISQLKLQKAEMNLSENDDEIERKVANYRSTLLIYKYEQQFIKQKLDTNVADEILQKYYDEYLNEFSLKWNIVKAIYVKIPKSSPKIFRFRRWFKNYESNIEKVEKYIDENAIDYNDFDDNWILFDSLISKYQLDISNPDNILKTNNLFEKDEENNNHFINILEYKLKNEVSPLSLVKSNIKSIILNKRKIELIKKLNQNVFNEGLEQNKFKIYK